MEWTIFVEKSSNLMMSIPNIKTSQSTASFLKKKIFGLIKFEVVSFLSKIPKKKYSWNPKNQV